MSDQRQHLPDSAAEPGEVPDDAMPDLRPIPEGEPDPEEYEPVDPDPEAIVDGGTDVRVPDLDLDYPHVGPEDPEPTPDDDVEP